MGVVPDRHFMVYFGLYSYMAIYRYQYVFRITSQKFKSRYWAGVIYIDCQDHTFLGNLWVDKNQYLPKPWTFTRIDSYEIENSTHRRIMRCIKHFQCAADRRYASNSICIYTSPVNSPHKVLWRIALIFSLICAWINGRVNNIEAVDLRRHSAHYDVIVMYTYTSVSI